MRKARGEKRTEKEKEEKKIEQRTGLSREEQLVNQIHKLDKISWLSGLYLIMVLFCCVVFALNMNYSQVLSGQLLMTVSESIMIGFFSFAYGIWFVFPYIWIKGKDGKMAQDLIESIYWMPCNVEAFFDVIFNKLWKKMKVTGIVIFLIFVAGMFVGTYTGERAGTGIGLQLPEHIVLSVLVCVIGTAWVILWMFMGWVFTRQLRLKIYYKKRNGQRTKGKLLKGKKRQRKKSGRKSSPSWVIEFIIIMVWSFISVLMRNVLGPLHEQGIAVCNYFFGGFIPIFLAIMCGDALTNQIRKTINKEPVKMKSVVLWVVLTMGSLFGCVTTYQYYNEDSIETSFLTRKQSYNWEDVVSYRVYATYFWGDMVLEMETADGKTLKIHTGNMDETEAFWNIYNDEDEYVADVVKRLTGLGVEGTMEDAKRLRKHGDAKSIDRIRRYSDFEKKKLPVWEGLLGCEQSVYTKNEDIGQYETLLGKDGKYKHNYIGYNDIFPNKLPDSAEVEEFYYEYYNPWDANYLGYLVYQCEDEDYTEEYSRLKKLDRSENYNDYGEIVFPYELCAVYADHYGIIYGLADKENNRFIYMELEFCNYFTDIDYEEIVDEKYLPEGFNAKPGNATRKAFEKQ